MLMLIISCYWIFQTSWMCIIMKAGMAMFKLTTLLLLKMKKQCAWKSFLFWDKFPLMINHLLQNQKKNFTLLDVQTFPFSNVHRTLLLKTIYKEKYLNNFIFLMFDYTYVQLKLKALLFLLPEMPSTGKTENLLGNPHSGTFSVCSSCWL